MTFTCQIVIIHQPKSLLPSMTGVSISWYSWTLSIRMPLTEHNTFTTKKSRYLNRRETARLSCQEFQRIWGSGESEIVQCWKSFKYLNKHSISWVSHPVSRSFNKLLLIWDRASLVITHGSHNPYSLKSLMFFGPLSWLAGIGPPLLQCVA